MERDKINSEIRETVNFGPAQIHTSYAITTCAVTIATTTAPPAGSAAAVTNTANTTAIVLILILICLLMRWRGSNKTLNVPGSVIAKPSRIYKHI